MESNNQNTTKQKQVGSLCPVQSYMSFLINTDIWLATSRTLCCPRVTVTAARCNIRTHQISPRGAQSNFTAGEDRHSYVTFRIQRHWRWLVRLLVGGDSVCKSTKLMTYLSPVCKILEIDICQDAVHWDAWARNDHTIRTFAACFVKASA